MSILNLETNIINFNFLILFLSMILYWLQSSLFLPLRFNLLPTITSISSSFLQGSFLILRWWNSGHFPLSNLYESLIFLSWSLTILLVFFNFNLSNKLNFNFLTKNLILIDSKNFIKKINPNQNESKTIISNNVTQKLVNSVFGSIITPFILLINTFATLTLPNQLKLSNALVPALQSNWLIMHVTVMMLSYALLLCGCLFSMTYLILQFISRSTVFQQGSPSTVNLSGIFSIFSTLKIRTLPVQTNLIVIDNNSNLKQNSNSFNTDFSNSATIDFKKPKENNFSELVETLDNLSYRILGLAFPFLTIGILSGAVWANQTWGSYWSWDPKETWALITWFVFAIYLHTRLSKGWKGIQSALLASFGFIIVWICYLGVNLMGKGLHSYGFLT